LVQFKSRTEKKVDLHGPVAQDLSIFVGRVNLKDKSIELFTLGIALFDRRVHEANGLRAWFTGGEEGLDGDGILNLKLERPILTWAAAHTEDADFTERAYGVLKQWLGLERWNRRYFRAGVAREILWDTNEAPKFGEVVLTWNPTHGREALADIRPLVHLVGLHARHHPELWAHVHAIEDSLRGPINDNSMTTAMRPFQLLMDASSRLAAIVKAHPTADVVVTVQVLKMDPKGANFWVHVAGRNGDANSERHEGGLDELRQKGFDFEIKENDSTATITLHLDRHFANWSVPHEVVEGPERTPNVGQGEHSPPYFLRRIIP